MTTTSASVTKAVVGAFSVGVSAMIVPVGMPVFLVLTGAIAAACASLMADHVGKVHRSVDGDRS